MSAPNCPKCGRAMILRPSGKFGPFYGCTGFPKCKGTAPCKRQAVAPSTVKPADRKAVVGSPQQQAIWAFIQAQAAAIVEAKSNPAVASNLKHLIVRAFAGTGKSFTCREALWQVAKQFKLRCLYVAFSKAIVEEFRGDLPEDVTVKTLNGQGASILCKNYGRSVLNDDKALDLFDELCPVQADKDKEKERRNLRSVCVRLMNLCQAYLYAGKADDLAELIERHELEASEAQEAQARDLVPKMLLFAQHRTKVVSFNDQLWLPVVNNLPCQKFDLIFVDEAQDLNKCQQVLVSKLLAANGVVVAVGDDNQAIFGFRGSDVDSINNLAALLGANGRQVESLPLSVSRRCSKAVIALAQTYVPEIEALPDAPEGEVINTTLEAVEPEAGDLIVCRTNAPLCSIAYGIIKQGGKAVIRGRDIGGGLVALVNRLEADTINALYQKLDAWRTVELAKVAGTRREETKAQQINDKADCILALAEGCDSVDQVTGRIATVFADFEPNGQPRGAVVLSSIHRAKGLEADRVIWACPEIKIKCQQEWQQRQELHLAYVAVTRAKRTLYLAEGKKKAAKQAA